jgi:hypothetical protein
VNVNHPGRESFDGEIAGFLVGEPPLNAKETEQTLQHLNNTHSN